MRATTINDEMKLAATHALAALAKEDVPDSVRRAYGVERLEFGREYLIPKPFDPRVLVWEASAVAEAAMRTGVAQQIAGYRRVPRATRAPPGQGARSDARHDQQGAAAAQARRVSRKARKTRSCAPARFWWTRRSPCRFCWAARRVIRERMAELRLHADSIRIVDPATAPDRAATPKSSTGCGSARA